MLDRPVCLWQGLPVPTGLTDDVRRALTAGRLAHLTTINPDGSPQASVVWIGLDGDDIVAGHLMGGRKVRTSGATRASRSPSRPRGQSGRHGELPRRARHRSLVEGGAPELLQRLAEVYVGPGVKFPPFDNPPAGHVIHITAERIGGVGPWAG